MKHLFKIMTLSVLVFGFSYSFAQTQKRYKKRNHKLQMNVSLDLDDAFSFNNGNIIRLNYAKNFGRFEVGVLVGLSPEEGESPLDFDIPGLGVHAGLLGEINFWKPNKRRMNWVPAFGLKAIYLQNNTPAFYLNPYLVSKHFISTRTSINIELEYPLFLFEGSEFQGDDFYWQGIKLNVGYAYYFH